MNGESAMPGPGTKAPVLIASGVRKTFALRRAEDVVVAVDAVSLRVDAGEVVSIVGPSGSGKSTLLACMSGLESFDAGSVRVLGTELAGARRSVLARLRRDHIGFVFQAFNLIDSLTARENVALPARLARRALSRREVDAALREVGLHARAGHLPAELSGGQQQRVAIARVLATRPDVLFADEPTGALDTATGDAVLDLLRAAADRGAAVVMVTHDLQAATRADRVLVMRDGRLTAKLSSPSVADVFRALEHPVEVV